MSKIPVYDQSGVGICYSYAASALIDAYRFSHGDSNYGHFTSPVYSSVITKEQDEGSSIEGGQIFNVIKYVKEHGSCSHQAIIKRWGDTYVNIYAIDYLISKFNKFKSDYQKLCLKKHSYVKNIHDALLGCTTVERASVSLPVSLVPTIDVIEKYLEQENPFTFVRKIMEKTCEGNTLMVDLPDLRTEIFDQQFSDSFDEARNKIKSLIDGKLNQSNPQPVGISFCSTIFKEGKGHRSISTRNTYLSYFVDDYEGENCLPHAAAVIGRRMHEGKCQYLIRNSYGTDCYKYNWPCEGGNVWIDEEDIFDNTFQLNYF